MYVMTSRLGIEPEPQWWEACALTTAPCLLPTKSSISLRDDLAINVDDIYMIELHFKDSTV